MWFTHLFFFASEMTVIQSVLFSREKWSLDDAKDWLGKHKMKT
jgi:hypothetical protein